MRRLAIALLALGATWLGGQASWAQQAAGQHLCTQQDLVNHTYRMIKMVETPPLREASWYRAIPYHYLAFYTENRYVYVASDKEIKTPDALRKVFNWPAQGNHTLLYRLDANGVLDLYLDKYLKYRYRCSVVDTNDQTAKAGDLILNGYTKRNRSHLYKIYRRWF